jgi:hypothetical protein
LQVHDHRIRRVAGIVHRFVILRCDLEIAVLLRRLHQQPQRLIVVLTPRTVPVHYKATDVHLPRTRYLLLQRLRIVAGIAHVNVLGVTPPRLVNRQQLRTTLHALKRMRCHRPRRGRPSTSK